MLCRAQNSGIEKASLSIDMAPLKVSMDATRQRKKATRKYLLLSPPGLRAFDLLEDACSRRRLAFACCLPVQSFCDLFASLLPRKTFGHLLLNKLFQDSGAKVVKHALP